MRKVAEMATRPRHRRKKWRRRIAVAVAVLLILLAVALLAGLAYEMSQPSVADAQARVAAIVQTHHGELGRLPVPARLAAAAVAVEDDRFYSNVAVNLFYGLGRAALAAAHGNGDAGGSTIAQQLAKQLYGKGSGTDASLEELALGLEALGELSRAQVLGMYLNADYYGNGYWVMWPPRADILGSLRPALAGHRRRCQQAWSRRRRPTIRCVTSRSPRSVNDTSWTAWSLPIT